MRYYKKYILFILLFSSALVHENNAQCPNGFYCPDINGTPTFSLIYFHKQPPLQAGDFVDFNFGGGSLYNGSYEVTSVITLLFGSAKIVVFADVPCSSDFFLYSSITTPDGVTCCFEYNKLLPECPTQSNPECEDFLEDCEDELIDIIDREPNLTIDGCEQWGGECGTSSSIFRYGSVAIGVDEAPPSGELYKLYVRDGILTEQFKLAGYDPGTGEWGAIQKPNGSAWCDYVFEKDYPLMPLAEVDTFIQKNKHLPNTPSAKEIEEQGGFLLHETVLNHQEKIEELFLHLIDLEKQLGKMGDVLEKNNY